MSTAPTHQTYLFSAMTPAGGRTFGLKTVASEAELVELLGRDKLLLLRSWKLPFAGSKGPAKLPSRDEVAISEQIQALLDRGVTLVEALEVAESVASTATKPRLAKLRELVAAGSGFADGCERVGGFDTVSIAVLRAAERTGDLATACGRLARAARRKQAMATKAITVMIYPVIVLTISLALVFVILVYLVPQISEQVEALDAKLPWYSQAVFAVGTAMRENLASVLVLIGGAVVACAMMWRELLNFLGAVGRRIGAIAKLIRAVELTRLFAVLAAMTRSGVPLAEALSLSTSVISDPKLRSQLERLQQRLVEGGVLRRLIEEVDTLPLATRRLLIAAERGGDLEQAFDQLSEDMAEDVDMRAARLLALLEPLVIIGMFAILAPLILAIAIPLMTFRSQAG